MIAEFRTYVNIPKKIIKKGAIYHSIQLPFDAEVAEKFLNGIYRTMRLAAQLFEILFEGALFTLKLRFSEKVTKI